MSHYATAIGGASPRTSAQIQALADVCGQQTRRHRIARGSNIFGTSYRRATLVKLSDFFSSIGSTDPGVYACTSSTTEQVCTTSNAIIALAGLARDVDTYADDSVTADPAQSGIPRVRK